MALASADSGDMDGVHAHLGELHVQLSAVMHVLWHNRIRLVEEARR